MEAFTDVLAAVSARPALYVGKTCLQTASHYLGGYCDAMANLGHTDPMYRWFHWVEMKFLICHPAWHWTRILIHVYGSDSAAFKALPGLYEEFQSYICERGIEQLDADHDQRLIAAHGTNCHEPEKTHTEEWGA